MSDADMRWVADQGEYVARLARQKWAGDEDGLRNLRSELESTLRVVKGLQSKCPAELHHGPGHQSTTLCAVRGAHEAHEAEVMGRTARWRGMTATSGFFDELPDED
jgi:hypothetical protein